MPCTFVAYVITAGAYETASARKVDALETVFETEDVERADEEVVGNGTSTKFDSEVSRDGPSVTFKREPENREYARANSDSLALGVLAKKSDDKFASPFNEAAMYEAENTIGDSLADTCSPDNNFSAPSANSLISVSALLGYEK